MLTDGWREGLVGVGCSRWEARTGSGEAAADAAPDGIDGDVHPLRAVVVARAAGAKVEQPREHALAGRLGTGREVAGERHVVSARRGHAAPDVAERALHAVTVGARRDP